MIQNLRDPSTPYFGALKMRRALGDRARLVTVDHGGHGVYLAGTSTCGDRAVTHYLTTGTRPPTRTPTAPPDTGGVRDPAGAGRGCQGARGYCERQAAAPDL
ncbi:hypothetical protein GCM10020254_42130 [Streptomyces goshikiensis]